MDRHDAILLIAKMETTNASKDELLDQVQALCTTVANKLVNGNCNKNEMLFWLHAFRIALKFDPRIQMNFFLQFFPLLEKCIDSDECGIALRVEAAACVINGLVGNQLLNAITPDYLLTKLAIEMRKTCDMVLLSRLTRIASIVFQHVHVTRATSTKQTEIQEFNKLANASLLVLLASREFKVSHPSAMELCDALLSLLILLMSMNPSSSPNEMTETTQLLLVHVLGLPLDAPYVQGLKARAVSAMLCLPPQLLESVRVKSVLVNIEESFLRELNYVTIIGNRDMDRCLVPYLMLLLRFIENQSMLEQVEKDLLSNFSISQQQRVGSLAYHISQLTNCGSSMITTLAGELLWRLSHEDTKRFVDRFGIENAIGTLQAKGLM